MHQLGLRSAALESFSLEAASLDKPFLSRMFFKKNIFIDLISLLPETSILPADAFLFLVGFRQERSRSDRRLKPVRGSDACVLRLAAKQRDTRKRTKRIEDCLADAETDPHITEKDPLP
jgi:hypothetical protein